MPETFRPDLKIDFQSMLYTTCINILIDKIGPFILKDFENASPRLNPLFHKP